MQQVSSVITDNLNSNIETAKSASSTQDFHVENWRIYLKVLIN